MEKILVSGCLLGQAVRYDGLSKAIDHQIWLQWGKQGRLVAICPEVAGGLPIPRAKAERQAGGLIINEMGEDVTAPFLAGAEQALALAQQHDIKLAVLKANSPSCGNQQIYDGSFTGQLITGEGVTAKLLQQAGIQVFNEMQLSEANHLVQQLETN